MFVGVNFSVMFKFFGHSLESVKWLLLVLNGPMLSNIAGLNSSFIWADLHNILSVLLGWDLTEIFIFILSKKDHIWVSVKISNESGR